MAARDVVIVAFDGVQPLDVTGPYEVFAGANEALGRRALGQPAYRVRLVAAAAGPVRSVSGLTLSADVSFDDLPPGGPSVDTLVVAGGNGVHAARADACTVEWVVATGERSRRVASVCTGAFLLAQAGLLGSGPVTTHWASADRLAGEFPDLTVDPDPIFIRNGRVWTSAGVTAGIDLALALVEDDHGAEVAQLIARWLVMFLRRPGGQSQYATGVWTPVAAPGPIRVAQDHINTHVDDDLAISRLARLVGLSPRHFQREFTRQVGVTPGRFIDRGRVEAARRELETQAEFTTAAIARRCGFGTAETMRRAFLRQLGVAPDHYRRRFAVAPVPATSSPSI